MRSQICGTYPHNWHPIVNPLRQRGVPLRACKVAAEPCVAPLRTKAVRIGATCDLFRNIDVFSAFHEVALLGTTLGKALKMSIDSKTAT